MHPVIFFLETSSRYYTCYVTVHFAMTGLIRPHLGYMAIPPHPIQAQSGALTSMLPLCLAIRKRKPCRPLISPRLPTDLPMTARKKKTPKPNTRHKRIPQHPNRKRSLSVKSIPGVCIECADSLEHRGHHERGDGVGCFGV